MPNYEAILNKKVVKEITADDFPAAKKAARTEFGSKVIVCVAGEWAHITSPEFKARVEAEALSKKN